MNILHRLVRLLVLALLFVTAVALLTVSLSMRNWQLVENWLAHGRYDVMCVGVALFCFALLFALTGLRRKRRARYLRLEGENGPVNISTDAICDFILKTGGEFPLIVRMKPAVIPNRRGIDVLIELRVKAGPKIQESCERLQQRVRECMRSELGISQVRRVEVSVREIIGSR